MPFPVIAREILATLMRAEANGKPISLQSTLDMWGRGSTWEDLVDGGYVHRSVETGVTVTDRGRARYGRPLRS